VSPILVRPVREQLEHDRVIRLLQAKLKRKHEVATNIGEEQTVPVKIGQVQIFPDLVLTSADSGRKLMGTVEVETAESVNHLEAMAQWAHLGRARAPFHLYVPAGCVDIARRLATENGVNVAEIWSFHTIGDQTRFTLVHRAPPSEVARKAESPKPAAPKPAVAKPGAKKRSAAEVPRRKSAAAKASPRASRARRSAATKSTRPQRRK
jgi:pyruvate/2-oxoglutarate dehydrogenase complex dihydrolipoamide acyltransferase (E2) component